MGNDGGSITHRSEMVHLRNRDRDPKNSKIILRMKYKYCTISNDDLVKPIVACRRGNMYNKDSYIQFLLNSDEYSPQYDLSHLKSLKSVKDLNLISNSGKTSFICPITQCEMDGTTPFIFLWTCGCCFAKKVLDLIKTKNCPTCNVEYSDRDIIELGSEKLKLKDSSKDNNFKDGDSKKNLKIDKKSLDNQKVHKIHKSKLQSNAYRSLFTE
ncbi:MAG: Protein RTF2, variant 2 [Marteilia pararefringens]